MPLCRRMYEYDKRRIEWFRVMLSRLYAIFRVRHLASCRRRRFARAADGLIFYALLVSGWLLPARWGFKISRRLLQEADITSARFSFKWRFQDF